MNQPAKGEARGRAKGHLPPGCRARLHAGAPELTVGVLDWGANDHWKVGRDGKSIEEKETTNNIL